MPHTHTHFEEDRVVKTFCCTIVTIYDSLDYSLNYYVTAIYFYSTTTRWTALQVELASSDGSFPVACCMYDTLLVSVKSMHAPRPVQVIVGATYNLGMRMSDHWTVWVRDYLLASMTEIWGLRIERSTDGWGLASPLVRLGN